MRLGQRWFVWVCCNCGGLSEPLDLRIRCFVCSEPASVTERSADETPVYPMYWACDECGGEDLPPEDQESVQCVTCHRTIAQVVSAALARSGQSSQAFVCFVSTTPS